MSADESIVFGMRPDPPPQYAVLDIHTECTIVITDSRRSEAAHDLVVERRMARIRFEQRELLVCERSYRRGKLIIAPPKSRGGVMVQSERDRPAR